MHQLETRELRYFVAVAEELHFGRAAGRLLIAQPALTKSIQRTERRLGVQLLIRSSRGVALTPAGRALLEEGRTALQAIERAAEAAHRAALGGPVRLIMKPGGDANLLSGLLAATAQAAPDRPVEILFGLGDDRVRALRDGDADIALLYTPFDDDAGVDAMTLLVEDRVAMLAADHPLAVQSAVTQADLRGQPIARWGGRDADWDGPEVTELAELISLVRLGRALAVVPRSFVADPIAGVRVLPVSDAGPSSIVLARRRGDDRPEISAFFRAAEVLRSRGGAIPGRNEFLPT